MTGRLAAGLLTACLLSAQSARLPEPSGTYAIGRMEFDWRDESRKESLGPPDEAREILVDLWYPADRGARGREAAYFPQAEALDRDAGAAPLKQLFGPSWRAIAAGRVRSHVLDSPVPAAAPAKFPLLVFSHGFGIPPFAYTALIEHLVSRGYVVASIAHTYEAAAFAFPDGRVAAIAPQEPMDPSVPRHEAMKAIVAHEATRNEVWAADIRFVLDRLAQWNAGPAASFALARRLDFSAVGAFGHSVGGRAVARACQLDARIRACVNEDGASSEGAFLNYAGAESPHQPFLFVQSPAPPPPTDAQLAMFHDTREDWDRFVAEAINSTDRQLSECGAGSYRVLLKPAGFEHMSFSDLPVLNSSGTAHRRALAALQLAATVTSEFFDEYLRGASPKLLDSTEKRKDIEVRRYVVRR